MTLRFSIRFPIVALLGAAFALLAGPALARCSQNLVQFGSGVQVASLDGLRFAAGPSPNRAIVTFVGHSSFQIDTPQGVRAITDYNGVNGFGRRPDIVTMNNAHDTHFTDTPEDGITYVLRGWPSQPGETEAKHAVTLKDMKVWNVPTNARDWGGGSARINGNSIFIYAIGDLCIAHLGHLHHRLTKEHLEELGRIDVLMVPIDGSYTMGMPLMADVLRPTHPRLGVKKRNCSIQKVHTLIAGRSTGALTRKGRLPKWVILIKTPLIFSHLNKIIAVRLSDLPL